MRIMEKYVKSQSGNIEFSIRVAQVMGIMNSGGVEAVVMNYYRAIDKTKVQFDFFVDETSSFPQREEITRLGGRIYLVPPYSHLFKYIKTLIRLFKQNNYTYRNVNIGLVNELSRLCNEMNISVWEVIDAAKTKPYGFQAFYPGPGLGGHCIPLDPYYLTWKAREYGFHTTLIESSMVINDGQPAYCVNRAMHILNRYQKAICGSKVLIIGVAYKQDIDDYRESPAIRVIKELKKVGAIVDYYDPWVPEFKNMYGESGESISELTPIAVASYDLVVITCAHSNIDYELIQKNAQAIFDTKNAMKNIESRENIEVL